MFIFRQAQDDYKLPVTLSLSKCDQKKIKMPKYDVVIIGSGLSGLLCGNFLSKEGMNVCILEKQHQFGGNLQTFKRNGKVFDTGIHYVGGLSEGQNLHQFLKYAGIVDKLNIERLNINAFDKINFQGKTYSYAQSYENLIDTLSKDFPKEHNAIKSYAKQIKEITTHFPLYNLRAHTAEDNELEYYSRSVGDFLTSITKNKTLQNVLAGNNLLYAGAPDKSPVAIQALITNSLIEGAYRFVDGSHQLADLLIESIQKNGGTLMSNSEVTKINVYDKKAESVQLANGDLIEANYIISAIHPSLTLAMTDTKALRNSYRERINNIDETISVFSIYVDFKPNSFEYLDYNYYHFNEDSVWSIPNYSPNRWPQEYLFLTLPTSNSKKFAETATAMTYMQYEEVARWENSKVDHRGKEYEDFKKQKAEKLIDEINKQFPGFKSSIEAYYTSTPLTMKAYTGTKNGSIYGIFHDCNEPLKTQILARTKVPNLLLSGQNTNLHGMLGTTVSAVITSSQILGMDYLIDKINNA